MSDRKRWNDKYSGGRRSSLHTTLIKFHSLAKRGKALEIACGTGENSVFLSKRGFEVIAFDISDVAIREARRLAKREGVRPTFKILPAQKFSYPPNRFNLIANFYFLDRRILPKLKRSLAKGGILIFETYNIRHLRVKGDFNRNYLLEIGELIGFFKDLEILYYDETSNITTLVARKP